ncbi:MAG: hypothetical protein KKA76_07690, partial [Proteobacteria bacterium]|nr:hypothetical protein [Pseudomonadota bacterium]
GKFFLLPQGIAPQFDPQSDAMARQIARQTITMLKDPESAKNKGGVPMMQRPGQQQLSPEEQEQMEQAMEMLKGMFGNPNQQ